MNEFDRALHRVFELATNNSIELQKKEQEFYQQQMVKETGMSTESMEEFAKAGGHNVTYTGKFSRVKRKV